MYTYKSLAQYQYLDQPQRPEENLHLSNLFSCNQCLCTQAESKPCAQLIKYPVSCSYLKNPLSFFLKTTAKIERASPVPLSTFDISTRTMEANATSKCRFIFLACTCKTFFSFSPVFFHNMFVRTQIIVISLILSKLFS